MNNLPKANICCHVLLRVCLALMMFAIFKEYTLGSLVGALLDISFSRSWFLTGFSIVVLVMMVNIRRFPMPSLAISRDSYIFHPTIQLPSVDLCTTSRIISCLLRQVGIAACYWLLLRSTNAVHLSDSLQATLHIGSH